MSWHPNTPHIFLETPSIEFNAAFSPDGRWLAYDSNETGITEVYVRPFPGPGGKWQVSTAGGSSRRGHVMGRNCSIGRRIKEFGSQLTLRRVIPSAPTSLGCGRKASSQTGGRARNFDLHPDGQRFAVLRSPSLLPGGKLDKVVFVLNFFDELRRLAPAKAP